MQNVATIYDQYINSDDETPDMPMTALYGAKGRYAHKAILSPTKDEETANYFYIDENKENTQILFSSWQNYVLTSIVPVTGLTYRVVISPELKFDLEQEINFFVKMSPKSTRNIKVRVISHQRARPNPIF